VLFENAFSNTSWTLPSHLSRLTGLYSASHGVVESRDAPLDEGRTTLAEILRGHGYATAGFASGPFLSSSYGFAQGFDHYDDTTIDYRTAMDANTIVTSPAITESALAWLRQHARERFFVFVHYWDVHYDFAPPPPFDTRFDPDYEGFIDSRGFPHNWRIHAGMDSRDLEHVIALYDGEIAWTDLHVGKLIAGLRELGVFEDSIVVVTADHGAEFFEHGEKGHRKTLYDEVLRVPLIFRLPGGGHAARRVAAQASLVDLAPTLLDLLGIEIHPEMEGRSLAPALRDENALESAPIYARLQRSLVAVRTDETKLVHGLEGPEQEFFDLADDPSERANLLEAGAPARAEQDRRTLLAWLNQQHALARQRARGAGHRPLEIPPEMEEQLRGLGYLE
jgi:arylsulfatase A-like enzyme